MSNAEAPDHKRAVGAVREAAAVKKPYQKPDFRFERVFETRALSCGKIDPTQSQCQLNRKNS